MRLDPNAVVVVTGGADGIGLAVAREALNAGARVVVADVRVEALERAVEALRGERGEGQTDHVVGVRTDVGDRDSMAHLREQAVREFGKVTMVVCCAGVFGTTPVDTTPYEAFDRVMRVNFNGVHNAAKEFMPTLIAQPEAHFVAVSSIDGLFGMPGGSDAYCASKHAVTGFLRAMQMDLAGRHPHVHVSCVHPGFVSTNILANNAKHVDTVAISSGQVKLNMDALTEGFRWIGSTTPQAAAQQLLEGVANNRTRILVGNDAVVLDAIHRLVPSMFHSLLFFNSVVPLVLVVVKLVGRRVVFLAVLSYAVRRWLKTERQLLGSPS